VETAEVPATATKAKAKAAVAVEPLSPSELKEMLAKSKESEDDDCLMCGS
jgi:ribonucleoside-diphosphate reductase alpha chain